MKTTPKYRFACRQFNVQETNADGTKAWRRNDGRIEVRLVTGPAGNALMQRS